MDASISEVEISFADLTRTLGRRKRMIALATLGSTAVTAIGVFLIPVRYAAEAVIMPPQPEPSSQNMMMGALAGSLGLGALVSGGTAGLFRNPGDLYVGLLKSRTVADAMIRKFDLRRLYDEKTMVDTRKHLARRTAIAVGKDLLIHVRVEDRDRVRAADMANAYIEELHRQNSRLALTSASQRRTFFEEQLRVEKDALARAETAFKGEQQTSGLISPSGQSAVLLRSVAELRAEIASREVQVQRIRLYAGPDNPEMRQIEEGITELRAQLRKLEGASGGGNGDLLLPAGKIPAAGLDYLRKMRDVKYHETLFELLSRQYEAARIDEARQSPSVQVVDRADVPDKKCWPPRALFIGIAAALAFMVSCWIAARQRDSGYERL
jgi:uncharacterized protein involved in exopolysaccharide biosynthesis